MKSKIQLDLSKAWTDDDMLEKIFTWLTQIGASPAFGSRPIGWYQLHQCAAIDALVKRGAIHPVCKNGEIKWAGGKMYARELFEIADRKSRQEKL